MRKEKGEKIDEPQKVCASREQSQTCLNYAEAPPNFMRAKSE